MPLVDGQFQVLQQTAVNRSDRLKQAVALMLACSRCLPCNKVVDLAELQAELHGIVPVADGQFQVLQQTAVNWSNRLKQALASCHGLTVVNRTTVVGDEVERSLFKAVEARYRVRDDMLLCCVCCAVLCCAVLSCSAMLSCLAVLCCVSTVPCIVTCACATTITLRAR